MWVLAPHNFGIQAGEIYCLEHPATTTYRVQSEINAQYWAGSVRYVAPVVDNPSHVYIGQFFFCFSSGLKEDSLRRRIEAAHCIAWERTRGVNLSDNTTGVQAVMDIFQSFLFEELRLIPGLSLIVVSPNQLSTRCGIMQFHSRQPNCGAPLIGR